MAGVLLGALAATTKPWVDQILSRFMDVILALPSMLMAIVVIAILGPSLSNTILAVSVVLVPSIFRVIRVSLQQEVHKTYMTALQTLGASWWRRVVVNAFPNVVSGLIVQVSLGFSEAILNAAALGFLGLGVQAPYPEWGVMLSDARPFIETAPWQVTLPGLCILLLVLGLNLLGDGLRERLDPKLKR
ncbi:MAG: ABC transporter permease [Pseudobdellovibrionaceae bacterium]